MKTLNNINTKSIYVCDSLLRFKNRIMKKFNLNECNLKSNEPSFFFGLYTKKELEIVENYKGYVFLIFGGSDLHMIKHLKRTNNISLLFISKNLFDRYTYYKLQYKYKYPEMHIYLNLVDETIFRPIDKKLLGKSIYIYDGCKNVDINKRYTIYNIETIFKVKSKLPFLNYIHSSDNFIAYEDMPTIYKQCFIGLRLTNGDGNANTVQEFEAMRIPIIHNQSNYGIKWYSVDHIISIIKKYYKYYENNIWNT